MSPTSASSSESRTPSDLNKASDTRTAVTGRPVPTTVETVNIFGRRLDGRLNGRQNSEESEILLRSTSRWPVCGGTVLTGRRWLAL